MVWVEKRDDMHDISSLHEELRGASDRPASYLCPLLDILIDIRTALNRTASSLESHSTQLNRAISALERQWDELNKISSILSAYTLPEREEMARKKVEKVLAGQAFKRREEKRHTKET